MTLRTKKGEEKYREHLKSIKKGVCLLCEREGLVKFKYWKIIQNNFPYGKIAKKHHMLLPLRHIKEEFLEKKEIKEFNEIKNVYMKDTDYNYIMEATQRTKSQPEHFHLHLITLK